MCTYVRTYVCFKHLTFDPKMENRKYGVNDPYFTNSVRNIKNTVSIDQGPREAREHSAKILSQLTVRQWDFELSKVTSEL